MTESSAAGQLTHGFLFSDLRGFTAFTEGRGDAAAADNAATGSKRWNAHTDGSIGPLASLVDNVVYVASADKTIRAFNAGTGEQLWSITVQGTPTMPAVLDGRVFVGTSLGGSSQSADRPRSGWCPIQRDYPRLNPILASTR